jgi:isoleucyl-tRNA synthetase
VGSIQELLEKAVNMTDDMKDSIDLHKPFVDDIKLRCEACKSEMNRIPEVIDCWFDSGSMPIAQWHYPFENKHVFESNFPADFICEGIDQTRGWFYSLLAISTLIFDKPAYKNIVVNELVLDKNGQKMSKSKGNIVDPFEMLKIYGADAIRLYLMSVSPPWIPKKFDIEGIAEVQRKFINTLLNTYSFFVLYANIDKFDPESKPVPFDERPEIDRWILSRLYSLTDEVNDNFNKYELSKAIRGISDYLIDDVSNWYVRRNRRRFWKSEAGSDKLAAYQTLYEVLVTLTKLTAPYIPFISEDIFLNLNTDNDIQSVHHTKYPENTEALKKRIDKDLEDKMALTQKVVSIARALRNEVQIKVRQPLSEIVIVPSTDRDMGYIDELSSIICEEINVKRVRFEKNPSTILTQRAKPNFKLLGSRAGKHMSRLAETIKNFNADQINSFMENGYEHVLIDGHEFKLEMDEVEIVAESKEGYMAHSDRNISLALNITLSEDLIQEGLARELVNRIQNLRKDAGFSVTDRIVVEISGVSEKLETAFLKQKEYICNETLASELSINELSATFNKEVELDKESFTIGLSINN